MANKKTIQQLEAEIDRYWKRMRHIVNQIDLRRALIKRIRMGKVKQPPPKGKKYTFTQKRDFNVADYDDDLPSFGGNPNTSFD